MGLWTGSLQLFFHLRNKVVSSELCTWNLTPEYTLSRLSLSMGSNSFRTSKKIDATRNVCACDGAHEL